MAPSDTKDNAAAAANKPRDGHGNSPAADATHTERKAGKARAGKKGMGHRSAARASVKREAAPEAAEAPKSKGEKRRERHEHLSKAGKIVLVAIGCLAMLLSVTAMACSGFLSQESTGYHLTGGVAATVNGTNITEDTVTRQIMSQRSSGGYDSDEDWAQYLVDNGMTPRACARASSTATSSSSPSSRPSRTTTSPFRTRTLRTRGTTPFPTTTARTRF